MAASAKLQKAPMVICIFQLQTATDAAHRPLMMMIESFDSYQLSEPRPLPHGTDNRRADERTGTPVIAFFTGGDHEHWTKFGECSAAGVWTGMAGAGRSRGCLSSGCVLRLGRSYFHPFIGPRAGPGTS